MTLNEAITVLDKLKPNAFSDEDKCRWIYELDGKVNAEVFQNKLEILKYNILEHGDKDLLIEEPYDDLYFIFMMSKMDFLNGEYARYSNDAIVFNSDYKDYMKHIVRNAEVKPKKIKVV